MTKELRHTKNIQTNLFTLTDQSLFSAWKIFRWALRAGYNQICHWVCFTDHRLKRINKQKIIVWFDFVFEQSCFKFWMTLVINLCLSSFFKNFIWYTKRLQDQVISRTLNSYHHHQNVGTYEPWHNTTNKMACAPSEDSDQSDQSLRCALSRKLRTQTVFMRTAKTLIRLDGYPCWSESSLEAHAIVLVLSWGGSYIEHCFRDRIRQSVQEI